MGVLDTFLKQEYNRISAPGVDTFQANNFYELQSQLEHKNYQMMDALLEIKNTEEHMSDKLKTGEYTDGQYFIEKRVLAGRVDFVFFDNLVHAHNSLRETMGLEKSLEILEEGCPELLEHVSKDIYPMYWS